MKLDKGFSTLLKELIEEERDRYRNGNGGLDKERCARAVVERVREDYPDYAPYMEEVGAVFMVETRAHDNVRRSKATGTSEEGESRDLRLFINVPDVGYVYFSEAFVGQVRQEVVRRRKALAADKESLEQLEWAVEIAGSLGASDADRMGDYVDFA